MFDCPVCGYNKLKRPADDFLICPCCGTEFSYTNAKRSNAELTLRWFVGGMRWHSKRVSPPQDWDPQKQLRDAGLFSFEETTQTQIRQGVVSKHGDFKPVPFTYGQIRAVHVWLDVSSSDGVGRLHT